MSSAPGCCPGLKRLVLGLAALLFAACEPEATPLPVDIVPTSAPTVAAGEAQPIRYAIESTTQALIPAGDYAEITAAADVQTVSAPLVDSDLGSSYDIVITLGDLPNSSAAQPITVALAVNTSLAPLDDSALADIVRQRIDTDSLVTTLGVPGAVALPHASESPQILRTALANLGLPDGFDLSLAVLRAPGAEALAAQLASINIDVVSHVIAAEDAPSFERSHLLLFNRALAASLPKIAPEAIIDLFTIPISYRAVPELTVGFTAGGFPLPRR